MLKKDTGHQNAALFIPKGLFEAEEKMQKVLKECAVVTHYRLKQI